MPKNAEFRLEKSITYKKSSDTSAKATIPESGAGAGTTTSKENIFTKKQDISQSKARGKKVNINYTLAFVKWVGDTFFIHQNDIRRYWSAAELILTCYMQNNVESLIEMFFVAQNANDLKNIPVSTSLDEDNKNLIMTKYLANTYYSSVENDNERYSLAAADIAKLYVVPAFTQKAEKISNDYRKNIQTLKLLLEPNQTALKLYKTNKDAAFAKWLADTNFADFLKNRTIDEKYLTAVYVVNGYKNNEIKDEQFVAFLTDKEKQFEKAIQNEDESTKIVTVKRSFAFNFFYLAIPAFLLAAAVTIIYIRKKKKQ